MTTAVKKITTKNNEEIPQLLLPDVSAFESGITWRIVATIEDTRTILSGYTLSIVIQRLAVRAVAALNT